MKKDKDTMGTLFGDNVNEALVVIGTPLYDEKDIKSI